VSAEEIIAGGELLKQVLEDKTGLVYEVAVPTSYAATIEGICAAPDRTMGFIPAQAYVLANDLCGVQMLLKAKRFGYTEYWAQFIVPRDSDISSLEDLNGKKWAYPDAGSTSGFLVPSGVFQMLGIEPAESFEAGGHSATARAIYNGEADFGTTFYSPYIDADGNVAWDGNPDNADVPEDVVESCVLLDDESDIDCSGFRPKDARRNIRKDAPDVIQKVKIVTLSDPIPNDGLAFGPEFPQDVQETIVSALLEFAEEDPDGFATAFDAYSWSSVATTNDAEFDFIRSLVQALGITIADL
jgi:phosphonate transport system substrate-binding protein